MKQENKESLEGGRSLGVEDFLGFVDQLRLAGRSESMDRNLLSNLDHQLTSLKTFLTQCDREDPHIQNVIRLLKSEMLRVLENRSLYASNSNRDQVFEYFSRISQEFNTLETVKSRGSLSITQGTREQTAINASLDTQLSQNSAVLKSNLFTQFYQNFADTFGTISDSNSETSEQSRPLTNKSGSYLKMEVQLERFLLPRMLSFQENDNTSIDVSLQRILGGFRRLLGQIKRLHEQGQFEGNIQSAFEAKSGAFETKLREIVHRFLQANVVLEKSQINGGRDQNVKAREAEILGQQVHAEMGARQTQNFEKLVQHQMRTTKPIFPFFYTCLIHFAPSKELLKESRAFGSLVSFFGSRLAPKLPIRVLHLLFVLDFLNSVILRRVWVVHHILEAHNRPSGEGKRNSFTQQQQPLDQPDNPDLLTQNGNKEHQQRTHDSDNNSGSMHGSNEEARGRSSKPKVKLYRGSSQSKPKKPKKSDPGEPPKEFLGFHELQQSELLQGSSLLKSMELGKETYKTSEDVTALMNSSFLATALEAIKLQKLKVESLDDIGERESENYSGETPRASEDIKQQIVNNLHSYFESHQSKMTFRSGAWDPDSGANWNADSAGKKIPQGEGEESKNQNQLQPTYQSSGFKGNPSNTSLGRRQTHGSLGEKTSTDNVGYETESLDHQIEIYGGKNAEQWTQDPSILSPEMNTSLEKDGKVQSFGLRTGGSSNLSQNYTYSNSLASDQNSVPTYPNSKDQSNKRISGGQSGLSRQTNWTLPEADNEGDMESSQSLLRIEGLDYSEANASLPSFQTTSLVSDSNPSENKKIQTPADPNSDEERYTFGGERAIQRSNPENQISKSETSGNPLLDSRRESEALNEDSEFYIPRYVKGDSKSFDDSGFSKTLNSHNSGHGELGQSNTHPHQPERTDPTRHTRQTSPSHLKQNQPHKEEVSESESQDYWNDFDSNKLGDDSGIKERANPDADDKETPPPDNKPRNVENKYPPTTESDQHIGKKFLTPRKSKDGGENSQTEVQNESANQEESFNSQALSSEIVSGYMESGQNIPKFNKKGKFHRNELEAQIERDMYSGSNSRVIPSQPSISTQFMNRPPGRPSAEWGPSDSLLFNQIRFESIEKIQVPNPQIQSEIQRLIGNLKNIQESSEELGDRRKKFDSIFIKHLKEGETFKIKKQPQIEPIQIPETGASESEKQTQESGLRSPGVSFLESESRRIKNLLIRQKFTDRLFPPLISTLCDDVSSEDFEKYAKFEFRRISDILDLAVNKTRIYPLEESGTQRYRTYKETQWEQREEFLKDINDTVIIDCSFKQEKLESTGRQIFKTICLSLEKSLGQKLALNLFPVLDLKEGKALVVQPFSLACPSKEPKHTNSRIKPQTTPLEDAINNPQLASIQNRQIFWNFYDDNQRNILGGIPENEWAKKKLEESRHDYTMRRDREIQLMERMVCSLKEDFPPAEYFHSKFIKQNFIFIPGDSSGDFQQKHGHEYESGQTSAQDLDNWELLKKMSFYMDDFLPIDPEATPETGSNFAHADFAFSKAKANEKFNDGTSREFLNLLPPLLTKLFSRSLGTYRRLFNAHPVELFRALGRAVLVKDLSSVENTEALHISLFPNTLGLSPEKKEYIQVYNNLSASPRRLLDHAYQAIERHRKTPSKDSLGEVEVSSQFLQVFEDMNIALNLMHFIKSMIENGNCVVFLGASKELYHVASVKGTTEQVKEMYMVLENHTFQPEILFPFQFSRFKYAYFVFLHSSLTQQSNQLHQKCIHLSSET